MPKTNTTIILMRHPNLYDELTKKFNKHHTPYEDLDLEFKDWNDLLTNPKYMVDPMHELTERLVANAKTAIGRVEMPADNAQTSLLELSMNFICSNCKGDNHEKCLGCDCQHRATKEA